MNGANVYYLVNLLLQEVYTVKAIVLYPDHHAHIGWYHAVTFLGQLEVNSYWHLIGVVCNARPRPNGCGGLCMRVVPTCGL